MQVDIWSDVVCPWCYIGKRRFEAALEGFEEPVTVVWHSFELDPSAPRSSDLTLEQMLSKKYRVPAEQAQAMQERVTSLARKVGLDYHLDQARPESTFDAHRLIHWAASQGRGPDLKERLLRAYFTEGERIGDPATLARLAGDIGLDAAAAAAVLADPTAFEAAVRQDEAAARQLGISGVPFFVVDGKYGVSGAQEVGVLRDVLRKALADRPAPTPAADGCDDDGCSVP